MNSLCAVKRSANWSPEEDTRLCNLVSQFGAQKWGIIAAEMPGRNGKQCRERWHNHLDPSINKEPWSLKEEVILIKACNVYRHLH